LLPPFSFHDQHLDRWGLYDLYEKCRSPGRPCTQSFRIAAWIAPVGQPVRNVGGGGLRSNWRSYPRSQSLPQESIGWLLTKPGYECRWRIHFQQCRGDQRRGRGILFALGRDGWVRDFRGAADHHRRWGCPIRAATYHSGPAAGRGCTRATPGRRASGDCAAPRRPPDGDSSPRASDATRGRNRGPDTNSKGHHPAAL